MAWQTLPEMPDIPISSKLFLILMVHFGLTNITRKITGKTEFNESYLESVHFLLASQGHSSGLAVTVSMEIGEASLISSLEKRAEKEVT